MAALWMAIELKRFFKGRRSAILGVWAAPGATQTPNMTDFRLFLQILVSRCLRIDLPGQSSLIHVAFFKPGPLGRFLGPTLAENPPKTTGKLKYVF